MHTDHLPDWSHDHAFDAGNPAAERGTHTVMWLTAAMMIVEIIAGWWFNSMALLADGWHMSSHVVAIGLTAFAYAAARRYATDSRFAFGTWKIEILGGFASAIFLMIIAALMVLGSVERLLSPQPIHYREAIVIAVLGLAVNLVSALILSRTNDHHHAEAQGTHHHHHDLNLKSAYFHVLSDAATSVLAIVALAGGWLFDWAWLDPVIGLVGALLVAVWAKQLMVDTGKILLDREMDHPVVDEIRAAIETGPDAGDTRICDLHVWRVGKRAYSCAVSVVTHDQTLTPQRIRQRLAQHDEIVHVTAEVQRCEVNHTTAV